MPGSLCACLTASRCSERSSREASEPGRILVVSDVAPGRKRRRCRPRSTVGTWRCRRRSAISVARRSGLVRRVGRANRLASSADVRLAGQARSCPALGTARGVAAHQQPRVSRAPLGLPVSRRTPAPPAAIRVGSSVSRGCATLDESRVRYLTTMFRSGSASAQSDAVSGKMRLATRQGPDLTVNS